MITFIAKLARVLSVVGATVTLAALAGCAAAPDTGKTDAKSFVFYPERPDPPRVQHLATFSAAKDVAARAGFADFVAGKEGADEGLKRPYGAALHRGRLYVADSRAGGVAVFDLATRKYYLIEGTGAGRLQRPINVTIDADGTKYVTDLGRNEIMVFDANERFVRALGDKGQFRPVDVLIAADRLYVSDLQNSEVQVLDKRSGKLLFRFGAGEVYQPTNLAASPEGDVYVVETGDFRVSRFSADGKLVSRFGEIGQTHGTFSRPKGIATDRAGRVYVGDSAFQNVQIFDPQARPLMAFGSDKLNVPAGISIDYDNVDLFRQYAAPGFDLEYVIVVVSQFDPDKVDVFGFGRMRGATYPADETPATKPSK
jgi:DNA-binding beta-propeller fold protein YncE